MYAQHFKLTGEAFSLTPDPSFLYLSPGHAEALAGLKIGLQSRRGLLVMVGEVGTGKTTLLYSLLSAIGTDVRTAYVANTSLSLEDMLRAALADFDVPCESRDRLELLKALDAFLIQCAGEGTTAALVIDEAQNLDEQSFENIRLLSNFESFTSKLLQIVLVGQPELDTKLRRASLRQVAERVAVRCHINPLTRAESYKYVAHRLMCVGGSPDLFTRGALRLVARHSEGIPRRINIFCHNALLWGYGHGAQRVSAAYVRTAVREWQGKGLITLGHRSGRGGRQVAGVPVWRRLRWRPALGTTAALLITGAVTAMRWNNPQSEVAASAVAPANVGQFARPTSERAEGPSREQAVDAGEDVLRELQHGRSKSQSSGDSSAHPEKTLEGRLRSDLIDPEDEGASRLEALAPRAAVPGPPVETEATARLPNGSPARIPDVRPEEAPGLRVVAIPRGATLASLARKIYGEVTPEILDRLKDANAKIVDVNRIVAGDTLRFPAAHMLEDRSTTTNHE